VSEKRVLWVVLSVILLCLKMCVLANKSSRSSYSSYSSTSYDPYRSNSLNPSSTASWEKLQEEAARKAVKAELEKGMQRRCSDVRSELRLEVDYPDRGMSSLVREVRRAELPSGAWLPAPLVSQGLGVSILERGGEQDRLCLDADESMLKALLVTAKPSVDAVKLGAGAWQVTTADSTATTALLSSSTLEGLKVKGTLVAFAPTDNLVVFADSASPAAVAQAAKYAAEHTRLDGSDGCVAVEPLVRTNGTWGTWLPNGKPAATKEVEAVRIAARECLAEQVDGFLNELVLLRESGFSGAPWVEKFDSTERDNEGKRTAVTLALDSNVVPQLLSPAQDVKLETADGQVFTMSWETFIAIGGTRLAPVTVKDVAVDNSFFFLGGLSVADFAGKKGVSSSKAL